MMLRRSLLFIPGNNPAMLQNGGIFGADSIILDVEDAVAPMEKDAARTLVAEALQAVDFSGCEKIVRINSLETFGALDIARLVPCGLDTLLVPKVESAEDIKEVVALVEAAEAKGRSPVKLIALLETPRGVSEAYAIARADKRVVALAFGAEDYTAALGSQRSIEGQEIFTARNLIVNAAAAAEIQSLDTPFTDANNEEGLQADTEQAKKLGFKGKLAINPRQIDSIHEVFNPSEQELEWAIDVIAAIRQAEKEGSGVASLHGKMVDAPIVARAERVLQLAKRLGLEVEGEV